jgi:hypothetical protein
MSSRNILLFCLGLLLAIALGWIVTPPRIIPPTEVATPATVYVINQDFHSRLVLPTSDERLVQYAYGDWQYFALHNQTPRTALKALFLPTQGTLGRSVYNDVNTLQQVIDAYDLSLLHLTVEQEQVTQLRQALTDEFNQNKETAIVNTLNRMAFVQTDQDYTLLQNSNHRVVEWLEALDCQVKGFVMWAGFRVQAHITD